MQMGMVKQILTPGVKNGTETDGGAEMLGVGRNGPARPKILVLNPPHARPAATRNST